jgi:hypothetical protein
MNKKQAKIKALRSIYGFIVMMCETENDDELTEYLEEDVQGGLSREDAVKVQNVLIEEGLKIARRLKKLEN